MFSDSLEEIEVCNIAAAVDKSPMAWIKDNEIRYVEGKTRTVNYLHAISTK
jgi:hypothetical protein